MKKEEQKSLSEINKTLLENIRLLPDECQQQLAPAMNDLEKFTSEQKQMMKVLRPIILVMFVLMVLFGALFGDYAFYSMQLEKSIEDKNNIIRRYQYQDSIYSVLLDMNDSTRYISYRIRNGKPVTYHQLEHQYDSLQTRYYDLLYENAEKQDVLELLQQLYPYELKSKDGTLTVYGPNYKEQLREISAREDSLKRLCTQCQYENRVYKAKLDLITNRYPIMVKQDSNSVSVSSPRIDSALMLLPYYRDKLTYDAESKAWSIVTVREKVVVTEREVDRRKKR